MIIFILNSRSSRNVAVLTCLHSLKLVAEIILMLGYEVCMLINFETMGMSLNPVR